ncbi:phage exclusion lipoprotein Cor [Cedecea lapagei]|uniref:phage exclusion lipoprotein Cor n=1 Tax=Cedecea lapagei TaxID=158823 RepID=UPI000F8284BF|nr:cor protein [Cedecea lapagei]
MKLFKSLSLASVIALSGCAGIIEKQDPVCTAQANIGGSDSTVQIYGVRKIASQTEYKAGYPFNWKWVSASGFKSSTCK